MRTDTAAKYLCDISGWTLSNLPLQKLLYLAEVESVQRKRAQALLDRSFQAWDFGPVIPSLYGKLKMFGADPVGDVFYDALQLRSDSEGRAILDYVFESFGHVPPGELIELTHWRRGAWAKNYEPGIKGIPIRYADIRAEAANRGTYKQEWDSIIADCQA